MNRRRWGKQGLRNTDDDDFIIFPNERLGNDYQLNWTLAQYHKITPSQHAFRNLHERGLKMLVKNGKFDEAKRFHVQGIGGSKEEKALNNQQLIVGEQVSQEAHQQVLRDVRKHLSFGSDVFVNDGTVGSHRTQSVRTRVISDSAATSLFLSMMLGRLAHQQDVSAISESLELTVYVCTHQGVIEANPETPFVHFDQENNVLVVGNTTSNVGLMQTIIKAAEQIWTEKGTHLVRASSTLIAPDQTQLIFTTPSQSALALPKGTSLYSDFATCWSDDGISRVLDARVQPFNKDASSSGFVEDYTGEGSSRLIAPIEPLGCTLPHPKTAVVMLNAQAPSLSKLSDAQTQSVLKTHSSTTIDAILKNKMDVYAIGATKNQNELIKAFQTISQNPSSIRPAPKNLSQNPSSIR
eukprot:CAMPEP_0201551398 /NCGR_PEP_ID=MMETSP0173_2-20130828/7575_1 /ASSEMBLY_ACC=CAM_ASM_000268 /TAXON_ID=218659 /ORGANISM="Vexillifera sp., Strain DIVA3 564/2" /LENGTH=408 /DNA_ID=CAMNT_0047961639 /DNA_START=114 /DNA_END=1336 /DNA_ORIENTATION=-